MNVVILGSTSGMGEALARQMAARGDRLFLLGRSPEKLQRCAQDLEVRGAIGGVAHAHCDLEDTSTFGPAMDAAKAELAHIDTVVVTAGLFATQDELEADASLAERLTRINFTNTVVFCETARGHIRENGTLCVFSSVAGERGRKPVIIYGASKAGLSSYLEGLDHKYRHAGLRVVTVKPGFVRTEMTEGLDAPPFAGEPEDVARRVLNAIERGTPVVYAPAPWGAIMAVIRRLPRAVMRRVGF